MKNSLKIKAISHHTHSIGKIVKGTKIKHTWIIEFNGQPQKIELLISKLSRKFELRLNEKKIKKVQGRYEFIEKMKFHDVIVVVKPHPEDKEYDLFMEGDNFRNMLRQSMQQLNNSLQANNENKLLKNSKKDFQKRTTFPHDYDDQKFHIFDQNFQKKNQPVQQNHLDDSFALFRNAINIMQTQDQKESYNIVHLINQNSIDKI